MALLGTNRFGRGVAVSLVMVVVAILATWAQPWAAAPRATGLASPGVDASPGSPSASPTPEGARPRAGRPEADPETDTAARRHEISDQQVNRILSLMESFVGFLGTTLAILGAIVSVVLGVLAYLGWHEIRKLREIRRTARLARDEAQARDFAAALDELASIADQPRCRELARTEPDLEELRETSPWRERYFTLLEG
jgi:hypothetical protein